MNFYRCPICLLIPRIIYAKYEFKTFTFRILCSNNHTEIMNNKSFKKICLDEIKCNECHDVNNKSEYYCKECFNILCKKCKNIHQETKNHTNIIDINIIDDNCFIHNEKNILYCSSCEENICNNCLKSQKHKGHEINELKLLDLKNLKEKCMKIKKNLPKNLEKYKLELIGYKKDYNGYKHFKNNNEIQNHIKELKNITLDNLDLILNMINDFDKYKTIKNLPNYMIYLNSKLIGNFISLGYKDIDDLNGCFKKNIWYCRNYKLYKANLLKNEIKDNEFFFNKNLVNKTIIYYNAHDSNYIYSGENIYYCHFFINEKKEGIIIYLNNKSLCYKNIETLDILKKILINNISITNFKSASYLICNKKEYLFIYNNTGSFEVFIIYDNSSEKIFSILKTENQQGYDEQFLSSTMNYFNKNIYVTSFYKNKIYIYNIFLNQLEIIMNFSDEIKYIYNKYFLDNNIYDFLFITTDKQCNIYELQKFSLKKVLYLQNIYYVLLSKIFNKNCFIISCNYKILIIDFNSNDILFQTYGDRTQCLFLWNRSTIIENYQIDSCAGNKIVDLFDGNRECVFEYDFWWTDEIFRIKLKKYGECLLRIGYDKTNLFYIKSEEEIKKENEELEKKRKEEAAKQIKKYEEDWDCIYGCELSIFD